MTDSPFRRRALSLTLPPFCPRFAESVNLHMFVVFLTFGRGQAGGGRLYWFGFAALLPEFQLPAVEVARENQRTATLTATRHESPNHCPLASLEKGSRA